MEGFSLVQLAVDSTTIILVLNPPYRMNWVLTRRPRSRRARDKMFSLAPAWSFEIRSDAVTQPNLSEPATRRSSSQLSSRVLLRTNPFSRTATPSFRGGASRRYKR